MLAILGDHTALRHWLRMRELALRSQCARRLRPGSRGAGGAGGGGEEEGAGLDESAEETPCFSEAIRTWLPPACTTEVLVPRWRSPAVPNAAGGVGMTGLLFILAQSGH